MSARTELLVRRAVSGAFSRVGTRPVSVALLALAAVSLATAAIWSRRGSPEAAAAFLGSWGVWTVGGALVVDAVTSVLRALPLEVTKEGRVRLARLGPALPRLATRGGYLLVAFGFVASLAGRDRFDLRAAEGEPLTGGAEQLVARDPPRPFSPGPFPVWLTVDAVRGAGTDVAATTVRFANGVARSASPLRPLWFGWGRFLVPEDGGWAVRYELAREARQGEPLDSAFAKLQLVPAGKVDSIRLQELPYRIYVRLAEGAAPGAAPALHASVFRGKLFLVEGVLRSPADALRFEGLTLKFPEVRRWVTFSMLRDPGLPLALAGAVLAAAGLVLRRRSSPSGTL